MTSNEVVAMDKMFEDQLVPEINPGHPSNWEHQHQCVETHDLPPTSEKWKKCEKTTKRSLPVTITNVTRMQNMEAYNFNKARMLKKNRGIVHKVEFFMVVAVVIQWKLPVEKKALI